MSALWHFIANLLSAGLCILASMAIFRWVEVPQRKHARAAGFALLGAAACQAWLSASNLAEYWRTG